jgi:hypothetical protein
VVPSPEERLLQLQARPEDQPADRRDAAEADAGSNTASIPPPPPWEIRIRVE